MGKWLVKFPQILFAVRRIITLLFSNIKVQSNTLRFMKILSKVFFYSSSIIRIQWTLSRIRSSVDECRTSDWKVEGSAPSKVFICTYFYCKQNPGDIVFAPSIWSNIRSLFPCEYPGLVKSYTCWFVVINQKQHVF